jgi:osmotically-inducible protein OsmY
LNDNNELEDCAVMARHIFPSLLLIAILAGVLAAGPQTYAAGPVLTDQSLGDAVQNELREARGELASNIYVVAKNGVILLTGEVDHVLAKEQAVSMAELVEGVRAVVDLIRIVPPYPLKNGEIRDRVRKALDHNPATRSSPIDVSVSANVVTLSGTVESWQRKYLAGQLAKGVRGVAAVDNRLTVQFDKKHPRSGREIKTDVEQTFKWDDLLNPERIQVEVKGGTVTLRGYVDSEWEKGRATLDAYVTGVTSVDAKGLKVEPRATGQKSRKVKYVIKSDAEIFEAMQDALLLDPRVKSFNVHPQVSFGIVTLRGEVDNATAKQAAEEDAWHTVGVRNVANQLEVNAF